MSISLAAFSKVVSDFDQYISSAPGDGIQAFPATKR
jgi:hypothetical protein